MTKTTLQNYKGHYIFLHLCVQDTWFYNTAQEKIMNPNSAVMGSERRDCVRTLSSWDVMKFICFHE